MAFDRDAVRIQQQLLVSLEAARAVATEANNVLVANPDVGGASLARAVAQLLEAQGELFGTVQALVESANSRVASSVDPDPPIEPSEVLVVAPAVVTTRTNRDYDYFTDLRRELANGEPIVHHEIATAEQDVVSITPTASNGHSQPLSEDTAAEIGEFPDDWGDPRDWVEAPRRLFRKGPRKRAEASPQ